MKKCDFSSLHFMPLLFKNFVIFFTVFFKRLKTIFINFINGSFTSGSWNILPNVYYRFLNIIERFCESRLFQIFTLLMFCSLKKYIWFLTYEHYVSIHFYHIKQIMNDWIVISYDQISTEGTSASKITKIVKKKDQCWFQAFSPGVIFAAPGGGVFYSSGGGRAIPHLSIKKYTISNLMGGIAMFRRVFPPTGSPLEFNSEKDKYLNCFKLLNVNNSLDNSFLP